MHKFIHKTYQLKGDNLNNEKAYLLHMILIYICIKNMLCHYNRVLFKPIGRIICMNMFYCLLIYS